MVDLGIDNAANLKNLAALLNPKDEDSSDDDMVSKYLLLKYSVFPNLLLF